MDAKPRRIEYYRRTDGSCPFEEWMISLSKDVRATVAKRIDRIERGLLGDYKTLNDGVIEFRIDFGPGYRIYAGLSGVLVLMLGGSDKSEQERTISSAKSLWKEYKQRIS